MVFEGVLPVLHVAVAPTDGQAMLDDEVAALARTMLDEGADGLVAVGLASESWALTEVERDRLVEIAAEACAGSRPLIVGIDGATTVACDRARRSVRLGAAGLMVRPPAQAVGAGALVRHVGAVAEAAAVPIVIQDSPQVTGVTLDVTALVEVARAVPLAATVKSEIPGAGMKVSALRAQGLAVVAGWGGIGYLEQVDRGAVGCFPGCDLGPAIGAIDRAARAGEAETAHEHYRRILPYLSFTSASLELLLLCAKRHLRRRGIFSTELLRAPARTLDEREARTADALLDELATAGTPGF